MSRPFATAIAALAVLAGPVGSASGQGGRSLLVEMDPPAGVTSAAAAGPVTVFLNMQGGIYTPAEANDSRQNETSVSNVTVDLPAWPADAAQQAELLGCVSDLLSPFNLVVTDQDPGSAPHPEAAVGGTPGLLGKDPSVAGISPFLTNCGVIDNSIVFVFPAVVGGDVRRLCETVAQEVAHSFGLDHEYLCQDPMTYLTGCGDKDFLFQESVCGEFSARDCRCSRTQNSARLLLDRLGRGTAPAMWLSQPSTGDRLSAGFPIQAVVTHPPDALDLYIDGVLIDQATPTDDGDPYQFIDFQTVDTLRSGTHHVELVALFDEDVQSIAALVEVEGQPGEDVVSEGCAAGGQGRGGLVGALALLVLLGARRRGGAVALGLATAAATQTGCQTSVFGSPPEDIGSGCPSAGDVSPASGVLWSSAGGTCTATLLSPISFVTAAHCVAAAAASLEPIVVVVGGSQYIADSAEVFPGWQPGAAADDVAAVLVTRTVEGVTPASIAPAEPVGGAAFTLVGHGEWTPTDSRDAERQAAEGAIGEVGEAAFSYDDTAEDGCLGGRGGGPVFPSGSPGQILGLHGEGRSVMRFDRYACWLACASDPIDLPAQVPGGCVCARAVSRPCNDCGEEVLDFASGAWSSCQPSADRPCAGGVACDASGYCAAPAAPAVARCTDPSCSFAPAR